MFYVCILALLREEKQRKSLHVDVRIQRAISPFVEVAQGAMCDLPESKFLTSCFSQSFAAGSFFSQLLTV